MKRMLYFIALPFLIPFLLMTISTAASSTWDTPNQIAPDTQTEGGTFTPVAMDSAGNAIAVWIQQHDGNPSLWASRYVKGKGWGSAIMIETSPGAVFDPQIAVDRDGNSIVVWSQWDGTRNNIWANRYDSGTGWSTATRIEKRDEEATAPQVAMDRKGNTMAVWVQSDGRHHAVWSNRYVAGKGWEGAAVIGNGPGSTLSPQIAMDSDGNAILVWSQSSGTEYHIWANWYTLREGWETPTQVEHNPSRTLKNSV